VDDLRELVAYARTRLDQGSRLFLATIVQAKGSTYRGVGARMMLEEGGGTFGTISGGCLEGDLAERVAQAASFPFLVHYDLSEEDVWSLGVGCNGTIEVLVEEVRPELIAFLALPEERRRGARAVDVRSGEWEMLEEAPARPLFQGDTFVDVVEPAPMVYVFGAGHDAIPLVALLQQVGFAVTVVDSRPLFLSQDRFPGATFLRLEAGDPSFAAEEGAFAIVMQHHKERDERWLRRILELPFRYVGCLGPRDRTRDILSRIGHDPDDPRLFYPVGLDVGAELPEAVAVSIVAECLAVRNGREGGFLRRRAGPIHG